ncbi:MAG: metalloregulator ArsR/SmtB family transcription factor [Planctomycetota bacterium]
MAKVLKKTGYKDRQLLFEKQAEVIKAVAHPTRIAILYFLENSEQCVCDISEYVGSERSNVSRHLAVMVNAGVLQCRKEGLKVFYKLRTPCILNFFSCIGQVLKTRSNEATQLLKSL